MQPLQFLSNTAETKIEMTTQTKPSRDEIVLKVRSIEVKNQTQEVILKLRKINELLEKKIFLEDRVRELEYRKEQI